MKRRFLLSSNYLVWEPGMNEWNWMIYVGFNKLRDEHIFQDTKDSQVFMYVPTEDIDSEVK